MLVDTYRGSLEFFCFLTRPMTFDAFYYAWSAVADSSKVARPTQPWMIQETPSGEILYLVLTLGPDGIMAMYTRDPSGLVSSLTFIVAEPERLSGGLMAALEPSSMVSIVEPFESFGVDEHVFGFEIVDGEYLPTGGPCTPSLPACGLRLGGLRAIDAMEKMGLSTAGWRVNEGEGQLIYTTSSSSLLYAISESDLGVGVAVTRYLPGMFGGVVVSAP